MWSTADECMWRKNRNSTSGAISNAVGLASALGAGNISEITASRPATSRQHPIDGSCLASSIMRVTTSPRMRTTSSMRKSLIFLREGRSIPRLRSDMSGAPDILHACMAIAAVGCPATLELSCVLHFWCHPNQLGLVGAASHDSYRAFVHLTHKRSNVGKALARGPPAPPPRTIDRIVFLLPCLSLSLFFLYHVDLFMLYFVSFYFC